MRTQDKTPEKLMDYASLLTEVKARIRSGRVRATLSANAEMLAMYWDIGRMIDRRQKSEGWGAAVIPRLSRDIRNELPEVKGFSERNIKRMLAFYRGYPNAEAILPQAVAKLEDTGGQKDTKVPQLAAQIRAHEKVPQAAAQLPWFHHVVLMENVKDLPTRYWYMAAAVEQGWPPTCRRVRGESEGSRGRWRN